MDSILFTPRMCPHATANSESGGYAATVRARLRSCSPRELLFKRFRFPRIGPWQLFALARIGVLRVGCSRGIGTIRGIPRRARPSLWRANLAARWILFFHQTVIGSHTYPRTARGKGA